MDWTESIIQLATASGFGGLVWYLLVKHMPKLQDLHREERKEWTDCMSREAAQFRDYIEKRDADAKVLFDRYHLMNAELHEALIKLIAKHERLS